MRLSITPLSGTVLLIGCPLLAGLIQLASGRSIAALACFTLAMILPILLLAVLLYLGIQLLAARLVGFQPALLAWGPVQFVVGPDRLHRQWNTHWSYYWGACVSGPSLPASDSLPRFLRRAALAAGLNLLAGLLILGLAVVLGSLGEFNLGPGLIAFALQAIGLVLLILAVNAVIQAARLFGRYGRGGPAADRALTQLALTTAMLHGPRPRLWPEAVLIRTITPPDGTAADLFGRLHIYYAALDRGDIRQAGEQLDYALARAAGSTPVHRAIRLEGAYFVARYRRDAATARRLLAAVTPSERDSADGARAQAAIFLAEGRLLDAAAAAQKGLDRLERAMAQGTAIAEREWLLDLLALAGAPGPAPAIPRRARTLPPAAVALGVVGVVVLVGAGVVFFPPQAAQQMDELPTQGRCPATPLYIGDPAPDFTAVLLTGAPVRLADYQGRSPLWIEFWTMECAACAHQLADLPDMVAEYSAKGLPVLSVAVEDDPAAVADYMRTSGYDWPVVVDVDRDMARAYCATLVPTAVLIDRQGIVRSILIGRALPGQLRPKLDALLSR